VELHSDAVASASTDRSAARDVPRPGQSPANAASLASWLELATPEMKIRFVAVVAGGDLGITKERVADCFSALKRKHKSIAIWHAGSGGEESPARKLVRAWAGRNKVPWVPFGERYEALMNSARGRSSAGHKIGFIILPTNSPTRIRDAAKSAGLVAWEV